MPAEDLKSKLASFAPAGEFAVWPYRSNDGEIVIFMAARGFVSQRDLETFAIGVERSAGETTGAKLQRRVSWGGRQGELTMSGVVMDGVKMRMRCITNESGAIGCIQVVGGDLTTFEPLMRRLSFGGCR